MTPENSPAETAPGSAFVPEFEVLPDVLVSLAVMILVGGFGGRIDEFFDVRLEFASTDVANADGFKASKKLLIAKPRVEADDDGGRRGCGACESCAQRGGGF